MFSRENAGASGFSGESDGIESGESFEGGSGDREAVVSADISTGDEFESVDGDAAAASTESELYKTIIWKAPPIRLRTRCLGLSG